MKRRSYTYKGLSIPKELKYDIDNIVINLEKHGRAFPRNPNATRVLSRRLRVPRQRGDIIFAKDNHTRRTVILVNPDKKLIRTKNTRVKFYPRW